jgi:hypothetical protein
VSDDAETLLYPRRFHSARERNERLGRWLRIVAGVTTVDERLLDRLGRWMFARDELGAQLVTAMRRPQVDPERVAMDQFKDALADGIEAVSDAPQALRDFSRWSMTCRTGWTSISLSEGRGRFGGSGAVAMTCWCNWR